jgi:signal transduction histidine kinase
MRETLWLLGGPRHEGGESFERLRNTSQRMLPHATIDWNLPDALPQFDEQSQTPRELLLMFKEIMANIAKHAEADQVNVRVEYTEALKITVVDNGLGTISESETGMGLSNIRQRTAKLGGRFEFESTPGQGSTVVLEIPM